MISAESPAALATSVARIGTHHSAGMLSRCAHLRAIGEGAPIDLANAPGEIQSPITSRNDEIDFMESPLGHFVLKCKATLSYDCGIEVRDNGLMGDRVSETEEKRRFIRRVKLAREARFDTQNPMLTILGLAQGTYKQYETRTPLPHRFIPKFCAATGVSMDWLLTGTGKGPGIPAVAPMTEKPSRQSGRRRAAA